MTKLAFSILSRQVKAVAVLSLCVFLLSSCVSISIRDPDFEKHTLAVNASLNSFLVANKSKQKKVPYSAVVKAYNEIEAAMNKMVLMARLADNNEKTAAMAEEIRESFRNTRTTHQKRGFLTPSAFDIKEEVFELLFFNLLSAERTKPTETDR